MGLRKLSVERLEKRSVMAGNVTASVTSAGDLLIEGDAEDNFVRVDSIGPGEWQVGGLNNTLVNGSLTPLSFTANRNVFINLRGGNDALFLVGQGKDKVTVANPVTIKFGSGNDAFIVENFATNSDLRIHGEAGDDQLIVSNATIRRRLFVEGNGGEDGVVISNANVQGEVQIDMGDEDDLIGFNEGVFHQNVNLVGGAGKDQALMLGLKTLRNLRIELGKPNEADNDVFEARGTNVVADLQVLGGGGDDLFNISGSTMGRNSRIVGDFGADSVSVTDSGFGSLQVDLGTPGDSAVDQAHFTKVNVAGSLRISTGAGDDRVEFTTVVVRKELSVNMGRGEDVVVTKQLQTLDRFYLDLGEGADLVSLIDSSIHWAWFDSGEGVDQLLVVNSRVDQWKLRRF